MILPCEIATKCVVPVIKAATVKELMKTYGLKQSQVAEMLGISQSAVSKYACEIRGHVIEIDNMEEIQSLIDKMMSLLAKEDGRRAEFLRLFCQACTIIRKKGLMCGFCEKTDPKIKMEKCNFCLTVTFDL